MGKGMIGNHHDMEMARYFHFGAGGTGSHVVIDILYHVLPPIFLLKQLMCSPGPRVTSADSRVSPGDKAFSEP